MIQKTAISKRVTEIFEEIIYIHSPSRGELAIHHYLVDFLEKLGLEIYEGHHQVQYGGNSPVLIAKLAGISPLLPDGKLMSFKTKQMELPIKLKEGSVTGGGTPLTLSNGQFKLKVPVAILTSQKTASSAEATLLSFKGLKNVKTFGNETAGYASANSMIPLYDGAQIVITVAEDVDRLGNVYNDLPIQPDVKTNSAEKEAQEWIKGQ